MRADAQKNYNQLLATAREVIGEQGADASLRDVARRAGVGLGTLYRHFPTREALLEALLRTGFDELTARAAELEASGSIEVALITWLRETVAVACQYRGVTEAMMTAIADPKSTLHAACVTMQMAGTRLLNRAQDAGIARPEVDGSDLFALMGALAWMGDQRSLAPRADHFFDLFLRAILKDRPEAQPEALPSA